MPILEGPPQPLSSHSGAEGSLYIPYGGWLLLFHYFHNRLTDTILFLAPAQTLCLCSEATSWPGQRTANFPLRGWWAQRLINFSSTRVLLASRGGSGSCTVKSLVLVNCRPGAGLLLLSAERTEMRQSGRGKEVVFFWVILSFIWQTFISSTCVGHCPYYRCDQNLEGLLRII